MKIARRCATVVVFSLLTWASSGAWGETRVVFTVDVESREFPLPRQVDTTCKDGIRCGLMEMVRMLREQGWAGTFFLNVYEYQRWGEVEMRNIATKLQAAGQDVALHTHPQWAYDPGRHAMYEYSFDEQMAIIRDGVQLLAAWTGRPVVAHRAGDYTADENTIVALARNGLRVDSSLFWGHPQSRLNGISLPHNLPSSEGRITEIPITVYLRKESPRLLGDILAPITSIRKIDPDWFVSEQEARVAIDAVIDADLPFLIVFLHSFSFLSGQEEDGVPLANRHSLAVFRAILGHIADKRLKVVTIRELAEHAALAWNPQSQDVVPEVPVPVDLHRYIWHRLRSTEIGLPAIGVTIIIFLIIFGSGVVLIAMFRRRRSDH